jgi:hypothetical protein
VTYEQTLEGLVAKLAKVKVGHCDWAGYLVHKSDLTQQQLEYDECCPACVIKQVRDELEAALKVPDYKLQAIQIIRQKYQTAGMTLPEAYQRICDVIDAAAGSEGSVLLDGDCGDCSLLSSPNATLAFEDQLSPENEEVAEVKRALAAPAVAGEAVALRKPLRDLIEAFEVLLNKDSPSSTWSVRVQELHNLLKAAQPTHAEGQAALDVETLAAKFHEIYQVEAKHQGDVRHKDAYADLPENIKKFDRVLARYVLTNFTAATPGTQPATGEGEQVKRFRCALCRKFRRNVVWNGGDRPTCRGCLAKVDALVLRLEAAEGYEGPHIYAGGIANVRVQRTPEPAKER